MLNFLLLCGLLTIVSGKSDNQDVFALPPEIVVSAQSKFAMPCIEETKADPDILKKALDGSMASDESSKKFIYCFAVKGNFSDEQGHFNIPRMAGLIGNHPKVKLFEETLAECNKITKKNPIETAFAMNSCLNNNSPVVFSL